MPEVFHGFHVNLEKGDDGHLRIVLNTNGQRIIALIEQMRDALGSDAALQVLLSDHLKRRWTRILPEEIGALTAAPIISDEATRDQNGKLIKVGRVYWHERYQVEDPVEALKNDGFVRFDGAS